VIFDCFKNIVKVISEVPWRYNFISDIQMPKTLYPSIDIDVRISYISFLNHVNKLIRRKISKKVTFYHYFEGGAALI